MAHKAEQKSQLRCYVAAPSGVSIGVISRVLQQRKIVPITPWGRDATAGTLLEALGEAIAQADLFVAVLGRKQSNSNVFFELGYACALGKELLIVAPPELAMLPSSLSGLLQVTADPHDAEAIGFALDQVLAAMGRPKRPRRPTSNNSQPIERYLAEELLGNLTQTSSAKAVEDVVVSAIQASGIDVIVRGEWTTPGTSFDLGIWSDDLDASVGNPLLIEVRTTLRDREEALQARSQAQHALEAANARTALVLYLEGPKRSDDVLPLSVPNILFMPIRELLDRLQIKGFGQVIRELRNRVAHQVAA